MSVALVLPLSGPIGLLGPSILASARLAVAEINEKGGIAGRELVPQLIDASTVFEAGGMESLSLLIDSGRIDAVACFHSPEVRNALASVVKGRVPLAYTPAQCDEYRNPNVWNTGVRLTDRLGEAIKTVRDELGLRSWAMVVNEAPSIRKIDAVVKGAVRENEGQVVSEHLVPHGTKDFRPVLRKLAERRPDAVFVNLMGQDAVLFNRQFGAAGLSDATFRISTSVEENVILASGRKNTRGLIQISPYISDLETHSADRFRQAYLAYHGAGAPAVTCGGQSAYDGLHFLSVLLNSEVDQSLDRLVDYPSGRAGPYSPTKDAAEDSTLDIARVEGLRFKEFLKA